MARIRTIKPDFWTSEALSECSLSARLLFIGTWNFADDAGNLERSSKRLKMQIFPGDNLEIEPLIQELITHGLLIEYSVSGKKYMHIPGFRDHQVINRPSKPSCPPYDDSMNTHGVLTEDSLTEGKGRERKGKEKEEEPGANAPTVWDVGVGMGIDRAVIGKQIKSAGEEKVAEVLAFMCTKRPADPAQYFIAATTKKKRRTAV